MKKLILVFFVCMFAVFDAHAVLKEKDLAQTLGVLRGELEQTYNEATLRYERFERRNKEQHTNLIQMMQRSNQIALKGDAQVAAFIRQYGKEALLELKRHHYNTKLEDCVIGADQQRMIDVVDRQLVPRTGLVFLTPQSRNGKAPFYSSVKMIGSWPVKTLWFNMAVLLLMSIVATILLLTDFPGRLIRKGSQ